MSILVISTSLSPTSRSRVLARTAHEHLADAAWLDVRDLSLPHCDGDVAWDHPDVTRVADVIRNADGIVFALGIYNFGASAVAKTILELGGQSWNDSVVGFLCAAGGNAAYMGVMGIANSLMLDFRCVIVPRFVYATGTSFTDGDLDDAEVRDRVHEVCNELTRMTAALRSAPEPSKT